MNILGIIASPRKNGCTSRMVNYLIESAKRAGHTTQIIHINELDYKGCQGCYACSNSYKCILKDDLQKVYQAIDHADEIILASPIYMWQISGQLKLLIDRLLPYYMQFTKSKAINKTVVFAFTQEDKDAMANIDYIKLMETSIERIGFTFKDTFIAGGNVELDDIENKSELVLKMKSYYYQSSEILN